METKPKLVKALEGKRVLHVALGSRDAQTLCVAEDSNGTTEVWSWGDGGEVVKA